MLIAKALCLVLAVVLMGAVVGWALSGYRSGDVAVLGGGRLRMGDAVVRLYGIAGFAAEQTCGTGQDRWACGSVAREALQKEVEDRTVRCLRQEMSAEGETVSVCYVGLSDIGRQLVQAGWALADPLSGERYRKVESQARDGLAGIWKSQFEVPAYWRILHPQRADGGPAAAEPERVSAPTSPLQAWLGLALFIGILLGWVSWRGRARLQKGSHRWRVGRGERVLALLRRIGAESGPARQFAYLRKVDPWVVEELVLSALEGQGHRIRRNPRYTGDGGRDGRCWIDGEAHWIQVKRYGSYISPAHVREFAQLCSQANVKGLFVHTGRTGPAAAAATGSQVRIVSGVKLLDFLGVRPTYGLQVLTAPDEESRPHGGSGADRPNAP